MFVTVPSKPPRGMWDKVFKNGPSKILKGCLPQLLLNRIVNTLSHLSTESTLPRDLTISDSSSDFSDFSSYLSGMFMVNCTDIRACFKSLLLKLRKST